MPLINISNKLPDGFTWFCEPATHRVENDKIILVPDSGSDFWQRTHYGFRNNNGHCLWTDRSGDFVLKTHVRYTPKHQFDQAGLIVYFTEDYWVKCSVEREDEKPFNLGSVVTNEGYSDWATQPFRKQTVDMEFMLKHVKTDFEIYCREFGEEDWQQLRISRLNLPLDTVFHVGIYACSPKIGGFEATFDNLSIDSIWSVSFKQGREWHSPELSLPCTSYTPNDSRHRPCSSHSSHSSSRSSECSVAEERKPPCSSGSSHRSMQRETRYIVKE